MTQVQTPGAETPTMTHRQILEVLSGLLLALFVAMVSSTSVSNALPRIVERLHGTQGGYTWVVVAALLAMTATTPIWGKLADLFSKKLLIQVALVLFIAGSAVAGLANSMGVLIAGRAVAGLGMGGIVALMQTIIAVMVPPRERGRYSGYIGATFALATVLGPLIGGLIVDSPLSWRGVFYIGVPFAVVAFIVLQKTLHVVTVKREVSIDYVGSVLLVGGVSILLVWVTLGGNQLAWNSVGSYAMVLGGLVVLALALVWEGRFAKQPIIPLRLYRDPTMVFSSIASFFVGMGMFGATVYLQQYFQTARGMSPTHAGLMTVCMVVGLAASAMITGRLISATGRWKRFLIFGAVMLIIGLALLSRIDETTSLLLVGVFMAVVGIGVGATNQNLILAVQNNLANEDMGAGSSVVAFIRSMGGSIGIAALGAVLSHRVASVTTDGVTALITSGKVPASAAEQLQSGSLSDVSTLPGPIARVVEHAFGVATGDLFLVATPCAVLALLAILLIKEKVLRTSIKDLSEEQIDPEVAAELEVGGAGRR
ncbi:MDR family MFS transporter [Nocardioides sp. KR10-350]|uniref:MDR family MFS transporter n=1 Tax=Nocardioides cheoyonin TaxID=3156615 RepID=UPI0032B54BA3